MGLGRFELPTPRLSSVCSNQLSYRPLISSPASPRALRSRISFTESFKEPGRTLVPSKLDRAHLPANRISCQIDLSKSSASALAGFSERDSRKEVIQPQVLLQLPCYDFTPITDHTLSTCLPYGLAQRFLVQPAFVM